MATFDGGGLCPPHAPPWMGGGSAPHGGGADGGGTARHGGWQNFRQIRGKNFRASRESLQIFRASREKWTFFL